MITADQFVRVMPSTPIDKLRVVYPPCDEDAIRSSIQPAISRLRRIPNAQYTFLSMNRFWPEKRIDVIVEAAGHYLSKTIIFDRQLDTIYIQ